MLSDVEYLQRFKVLDENSEKRYPNYFLQLFSTTSSVVR